MKEMASVFAALAFGFTTWWRLGTRPKVKALGSSFVNVVNIVATILFFLYLFVNLLYQHLSYEGGEGSRDFNVFLRTYSIGCYKLMLLGELLRSLLCLNEL